MKKVAYIASECVPFIKTGGLADVVGTLPKIFDKNEYDVRVIMPNYLCIPNKYREKMQYITHFYMDIGYKNDYVGVMYLEYEGVKVYFIDNEYYFNGFTPYGDVKWDIEKFCYFSKAETDSRRSVLLQCIGASPVVEPDFVVGQAAPGAHYMLCSDGFRHKITPQEMIERLGPGTCVDEAKMKEGCEFLTELVKYRKETDNVTVVLIKSE